jgi:hypothetical protein
MSFHDVANEITTILRNHHTDLGVSQDAIFIVGENITSITIPERLSIAIIPKESISLENFESTFWKCSVEITVYAPTIFRCFEIIQLTSTILRQESAIALSQSKIHKHQSTAQSTTLIWIAQTIVELT